MCVPRHELIGGRVDGRTWLGMQRETRKSVRGRHKPRFTRFARALIRPGGCARVSRVSHGGGGSLSYDLSEYSWQFEQIHILASYTIQS